MKLIKCDVRFVVIKLYPLTQQCKQYNGEDDNFALATRQDDKDWAAYVFWALGALIYAEEKNITALTPNEMPLVFVFGEDLSWMMKGAVLAVGNYGQIYSRHVEPFVPRGGRNQLNTMTHLGPQYYPIPGFFQ